MIRRLLWLLAFAVATAAPPPARAATAAAASTEGYCDIRVSDVASPDGGRTIVLALAPVDPGHAVLSGTLALYTADDRRYDLPFTQLAIDSQVPALVAYRFPTPIVPAAVYLTSLGGSSGGACGIFDPWTPQVSRSPAGPPSLAKAIGGGETPTATEVVDSGRLDPPTCAQPTLPARTLRAVSPVYPYGTTATGQVVVMVTVGSDGRAVEARVGHMEGSLATDRMADAFAASAIAAANASTFQTNTFRCKHVFGTFAFIVMFRKP